MTEEDYESSGLISIPRNLIDYARERIAALETENARLTALVAVGREMADHLDKLFGPHFPSDLAKKWRSLEGER